MSSQRSPITARAAALAPTTVDVRSCHAGSLSLGSPVTASDSSRGSSSWPGSAQLRDDVGCEELDVVEVGLVENLEVHPLHTRLGVGIELVRDLAGRANQR